MTKLNKYFFQFPSEAVKRNWVGGNNSIGFFQFPSEAVKRNWVAGYKTRRRF